MGFIEVAVGPYLDQYFQIDGKTSGYYFLVFSALYALGAPVIGSLVDRGHGGKMFASSSFLAGLGFVMMFVPMLFTQVESPYWLMIWLGVEGLAGAGCFVTAQLVFESIAYAVGFDEANKIKGIIQIF
ncbi:uncharacterized protein LOC142341397 [Convolutriloba macropyga]|uniref:uncharacterized protein LOC142341397 n=1 Tax=Convolutriloba macropyga TaxID=536237 RepID=UPI003F522C1F